MDNRARPTRITAGWRIALAASLLLGPATAGLAAPSWKPLPPFGGQVLVLAAAEGAPLLYAGTETAGPARSSNGGATWMASQVPEPVRVMDLAVEPRNPRVVFAAAVTRSEGHSAGVLRSLDGGASWQPANRGLGDETPLRVQDLAVDPSDPQKLYAATMDGLFLTRDRGASWQQVGLDGSSLCAVAADPFRPGVLFVSAEESQTHEAGLFVSLDGGATWTSSDQGIEGDPLFQALVFHPTIPNTLYALGNVPTFGTYFPAYVSRDGGATWTSLGAALISLAFGPAGVLFGVPGDHFGVLKSVDGGLHWTQTGPFDTTAQVLRVNGRLYAAGYQGVWISTDNGAHWRPSSQGLSARSLIRGLKESRSGLYSTFGGEGVFASRTGGTSWQQLHDPNHPGGRIHTFLAAGPDADYAREDFGGSFIVRSTDGGATWSELADPGLGGYLSALAVDPRHPAILYAGSVDISDVPGCRLARSLDTGRTWTCLAEEASVSAIAVERTTSTPYLIAAGNIFALVGGTKLEDRSTGLPPNGVDELAFDRRRAGTLYAVTEEGIFKTVDGGKSWARLSRGLPAGKAYSVAVDPHRRDVVYAGFRGRVYRSLDAGRTWQPFGNGLPGDTPIEELLASATNARRLYAVVEGHGLFWQAR